MDFDVGFVIDGDEFGFVEIKHFAEFLGDLKLEGAVARRESLFVADPNEFLGIGIDVAAGGEREAEGSGAEDVGDETE